MTLISVMALFSVVVILVCSYFYTPRSSLIVPCQGAPPAGTPSSEIWVATLMDLSSKLLGANDHKPFLLDYSALAMAAASCIQSVA